MSGQTSTWGRPFLSSVGRVAHIYPVPGAAAHEGQPPPAHTWEIGDPFPVQLVGDADFDLVQGVQDVQLRQGQPEQARTTQGEEPSAARSRLCLPRPLAYPLLPGTENEAEMLGEKRGRQVRAHLPRPTAA